MDDRKTYAALLVIAAIAIAAAIFFGVMELNEYMQPLGAAAK
jgi:hypothetical protein